MGITRDKSTKIVGFGGPILQRQFFTNHPKLQLHDSLFGSRLMMSNWLKQIDTQSDVSPANVEKRGENRENAKLVN